MIESISTLRELKVLEQAGKLRSELACKEGTGK